MAHSHASRPFFQRALSTLVAASATSTTACDKSPETVHSESDARDGQASSSNVYDFELQTIDGERRSLESYRGKVLLIVNVASRCGFTPQYEGLQELHERYADEGLVVMGVPSNDFLGQEPGTNEEIKNFCETKFHVTFDLFEKVHVKGSEQHPLYAYLTSEKGKVSWNFNKFLIDRKGRVIEKYGSMTKPLNVELQAAITKALKSA